MENFKFSHQHSKTLSTSCVSTTKILNPNKFPIKFPTINPTIPIQPKPYHI